MLTDEQQRDIEWALADLLPRQEHYRLYREYYTGIHRVMIDRTRLRNVFGNLFNDFHLNLCSTVVDALTDRLEVTSFSAGEGDDQDALELWKRNRMHRRAGQVHLEAVSTGDSYVLVWPDPQERPTLYPQKAHEFAVHYSKDEPGRILKAAKMWRADDGGTRLTIYYPDRVERFISRGGANLFSREGADMGRDSTTGTRPDADASQYLNASSFEQYFDEGDYAVRNPIDVVPVAHFANNADLGNYGTSEIADAVPVQDMLNYLMFSILVGVEFAAMPQKYFLNVEIPRDPETGEPVNVFKAGPEKVWALSGGEHVQAGQFGAADLAKMVQVMDAADRKMAQTTGTPIHYFQASSNLVSGESQKTAEGKLDSKVKDRQTAFGDAWSFALGLAVRMEKGGTPELDTNWKDTKPRNEKEDWEIATLKSELGVSKAQVLRERGYTDKQIKEFASEDTALGLGQEPPDPVRDLLNGNGFR